MCEGEGVADSDLQSMFFLTTRNETPQTLLELTAVVENPSSDE